MVNGPICPLRCQTHAILAVAFALHTVSLSAGGSSTHNNAMYPNFPFQSFRWTRKVRSTVKHFTARGLLRCIKIVFIYTCHFICFEQSNTLRSPNTASLQCRHQLTPLSLSPSKIFNPLCTSTPSHPRVTPPTTFPIQTGQVLIFIGWPI